MKKIIAVIFVVLAGTYQLACNKSATPTQVGSAALTTNTTVTSTTIASGLPQYAPFGLTVDNGGNIYYCVNTYYVGNSFVVMINPQGASTTVFGGTTWHSIRDVATDSPGVLYLGVGLPGRLIKVDHGVVTVLSHIHRSFMTLHNGLVYAGGNYSSGIIYSVPITGGAPTTVATGFHGPHKVVFDKAGNIFVADTYNGRIVKVTPAGVQTNFATGLSKPWGLAIDNQGNLYATEKGNGKVDMFDIAGAKTVLHTYSQPRGLWVSPDGNTLIVGDSNNHAIYKLTKATFP